MKFDRYSFLIFLLFLILIGLRVFHMTADPPANLSWSGGLFFDEGALAHNARNQVLFGQWKLDDWNDFYYSPILAYIKWVIFALFGVGMVQLRLVSLLFTTATLALLYFSLKISQTRIVATLGMLLLGLNYVYLMYSRLGLTEISVVFFAVLTLYFWLLGMHAPPGWKRGLWMFLAGVSCCCMVYIFKTLLIYFLPVPVIALMLFWIFPNTPSDRQRLLRLTGWCLLGMVVTAAIWLWVFYLPNYEPIHQAGSFVKMLSLPRSPQDFAENVARAPFFDIFTQTPIHLLLTIGYFVYIVYGLLHERSKLSPLDVFAGLWFLAHLAFFLGYSYRPTRYYVPIIPAMSILTVRAISGIAGISGLRIPFIRLSVWFWTGCWLIASVLFGFVIIPLCYQYGALPFVTIPEVGGNTQIVIGMAISLVCVLALSLWMTHNRGVALRTPAFFFKGVGGLLLVGFLGINGAQYYRWASAPQYVIRDISRELGSMLENAFIAGLPAPMLSMENTHRALYVWENFTNYQNTFQKYPITHLFLAEFNDELGYYKRKFPDIMRRARLLKTYWIKGSRFHLFSVVDPSVENIRVSQNQDDVGEPVTITFEIANNDPRQAKLLKPGMLLLPEDSAFPVFSAQEEVYMGPLARAQISLSREVPPGTYTVLAALFPEQYDSYEAEALRAQGGEIVADVEASGGNVRYAPAGFSGYLSYGPYRQYPAGKYDVEFVLKYRGNPSDIEGPLVTLDVSADAGRSIIAAKTINVMDFAGTDDYQPFRLSFLLKKPEVLEFRILTHGQAELWADVVRIAYIPGKWHTSPIVVRD